MVDGFNGLRHNPIIRSYDQHHNVRKVCPPGSHGGKRFVPRRINKGYPVSIDRNLISPNVLGNTTCFTRDYVSFANFVQQ
ncbi:hypothetical protein SDC9_183207 [bioreactor metagenome]|uniref:Uncharacterized protein n=1 Tax=bioreactor metagenome TaxID=1076179 RepID=A0A645HC65_9ZZZZ